MDVKFRPRVKFSTSIQVEKIGVTRDSQPKAKLIFFFSFHPWVEIYLQRFAAYFTNMFYSNFIKKVSLRRRSGVFNVNFVHILHLVLVFLLLALNM